MIATLAVNFVLVAVAIMLPSEVLEDRSYLLYAGQLVTMLPYLAYRAYYAKNVFTPSVFGLLYFLINLTLGAYLVPRGFGWAKDYTATVAAIETYRTIVPYLLLANIVLFLLSCRTIKELSQLKRSQHPRADLSASGPAWGIVSQAALLCSFVVVGYLGVFGAFAIQLAILVVHITELAGRKVRYRFLIYSLYLVALLTFTFENKREIAMALFLIVFVESYFSNGVIRLAARPVASLLAAALSFLMFVMAASVLRGYGNFDISSAVQALIYVPQYMSSDIFVDGITDNLELNYNYGSAITSMDFALTGTIPYQFGASLWKVMFLPIPREIFAAKPESVMQIFTQAYAPELWAANGSLPVALPAEMFVNFSYMGLISLALIVFVLDKIFVCIFRAPPRSFGHYSALYLTVTLLVYVRGGGLEQYLLTYLIAVPVILCLVSVGRLQLLVDNYRKVKGVTFPQLSR